MRSRTSAVFFGTLLVTFASLPAASQTTSQTPRSDEDSARAFLTHKDELQRARASRIADQANLRDLNALVRAVSLNPPAPRFVKNVQILTNLQQAFITDIAQILAISGFKAGDLYSDPPLRDRIVKAAASRLRGSATIEQEVLLADTVIIGTVTMISPVPLSDGFRSSLPIKADQIFKGSIQPGETILVRRLSGPDGEKGRVRDTSEVDVPVGRTVAIIGSRGAYRDAQRGNASCSDCVVEQVPIFLVSGSTLIPTGGYQQSGEITQLQRGAQQ